MLAICTRKLKKLQYIAVALVFIAVIVLIPLSYSKKKADKENAPELSVPDRWSRVTYLNLKGLNVDEEQFGERQVTIPEEFNTTYQNYNSVQLRQGFDLSRYKGEEVTEFTYDILNWGNDDAKMQAVVLVRNAKIIGAHIQSLTTQELLGIDG
jgi:hypothetical protein